MMVLPLSERPVTEEDEEQFRRESMPRKYTLRQRWADYRAEARANRPKGAKARVRAWLHVEPFYWGMRAAYVVLVVGAVFAVYINGIANGWWHAWGEKPTVAATTTPAARPAPSVSSSTDAAMSGGYQIGPDGVLVRPAEHAASTYTKPELPEEAKENTERGAELAAEYLLDTLTYAWNTGDTQPFEDITQPGENFRETYIQNINNIYSKGWLFGNNSTITNIVAVEPVSVEKFHVEPNTIGVAFEIETEDGIACTRQKITNRTSKYKADLDLFMTWKNGRWILTDGGVDFDVES
ncbi:DUF6318 family protein [Actinomyces sp. ICM47]|uniref:DUF6318 family protein n=1 Tax=Actinomyces sp. ICM47 TaxID=936548 RepID=UPI0025BF601B|nr:DUF6318 family protein [Actinomyces sp. ICM47]